MHNMRIGLEMGGSMNRRSFVKHAAALSGLGLSASLWARKALDPQPDLRVGIIGFGRRGMVLLRGVDKCKKAKVVHVCDRNFLLTNTARHNAGYQKIPIKKTEEWRRVVDDPEVDAVVIATPDCLHAPMALRALEAGKHVYCETPVGYTIQECLDLKRVASASKAVFQSGHTRRYHTMYCNARKRILDGEIGKVTMVRGQWHESCNLRRAGATMKPDREREVNWHLYREFSGGLLSRLSLQQIDTVNWFLGASPESVIGMGGVDWHKDGRDVCDNLCVTFTYPGGVRFSYTANLANTFNHHLEHFMGTDGTIETSTLFGGCYYADISLLRRLYSDRLSFYHQSVFENELTKGAGWWVDIIPGQSRLLLSGTGIAPSVCGRTWGMEKNMIQRTKFSYPAMTLFAIKDFIHACMTGEKPKADVSVGAEAAIAAHMANIAIDENRVVRRSEFV